MIELFSATSAATTPDKSFMEDAIFLEPCSSTYPSIDSVIFLMILTSMASVAQSAIIIHASYIRNWRNHLSHQINRYLLPRIETWL